MSVLDAMICKLRGHDWPEAPKSHVLSWHSTAGGADFSRTIYEPRICLRCGEIETLTGSYADGPYVWPDYHRPPTSIWDTTTTNPSSSDAPIAAAEQTDGLPDYQTQREVNSFDSLYTRDD